MIKYVDYINGNDSNGGTSFQDAYQTISKGASVTSGGDFVRVAKSPDPTLLDTGSVWTTLSRTVTLSSGHAQLITDCETSWTAIAPTTAATNATRKNGSQSAAIAVSNTQTGKLAYFTLASLDLSAYQQISFWVRPSVASVPSGKLSIRLCSDTTGSNTLNTFVIPAATGLTQFQAFTINNGSALATGINSIALYAESTLAAATTFLLDNFIACKSPSSPDSISLTSLISRNTGSREDAIWYPIQSISGSTITIDNHTNNSAGAGRGYYGVSASGVNIFKRETIKTSGQGVNTNALFTISGGGSSTGAYLDIEGGYNTGTTGQDGQTFYDGQNGFGLCIKATSRNYVKTNLLSFIKYNDGYQLTTCNNWLISNSQNNASTNNGIEVITSCQELILNSVYCCNNSSDGLSFIGTSCGVFSGLFLHNNLGNGLLTATSNTRNRFIDIESCNNATNGLSFASFYENLFLGANVSKNNSTNGILFGIGGTSNDFYNFTTSGNTTSSVNNSVTDETINYFYNTTFSEASPIAFVAGAVSDYCGSRVYSNRNNNVDNAHTHYSKNWRIDADTSTVFTTGNISWKLSPTSSTAVTLANPSFLYLGQFWVNTGSAVSINAKIYRNNTGIIASLLTYGSQLGANDISASTTGVTGVWENVSINIGSPTKAGVIEPLVQVYGGTTFSAWVDQATITVIQ